MKNTVIEVTEVESEKTIPSRQNIMCKNMEAFTNRRFLGIYEFVITILVGVK